MPFACIYVPNFPVAAALRAEPELQAHAVAILEGKPPLEKIIAVDEKAARAGIAPGMTKAQAELCPELALRPRSMLQESAAHAALLDCAQSFSPCVEDAACDTALLDLAGMESLLGSLPEISRAIGEPRRRARTHSQCCRSFQSRCSRARRSRISRRHCDSLQAKKQNVGILADEVCMFASRHDRAEEDQPK